VTLFDAVLVHGDPRVLPLEASWPVTPEIAGKLVYTGYLAASAQSPHPEEPRSGVSKDGPTGAGASWSTLRDAISGEMAPQDEGLRAGDGAILVSGGGSAAALPLFETTLSAARLLPRRAFRLLIGRGVAEADFNKLRQSAPDNARIERARPDFPALLAACKLSISQAGYNTVLDLLQAGRPALLVPFDAGNETEQGLRASALERVGLAQVVKLDEGPRALAAAIEAALARGVPPAATVDLNGAEGTIAAIAKLLANRG